MAILPAPTTPGYQQITQAQALTALAERLGDQSNVYWVLPELRLYLAEALRTWQALTGWYRGPGNLTVTAGETWYDLSTALSATNPLSYNVTDQYLVSLMLYQILENQLAGGAWAGTDQFDLAQIQNALQNRLNRFLGDTGCVVTLFDQTADITPPATRIKIQPTIIDLRRVAWTSATSGLTFVLWRANEWEMNSFQNGWIQNPSDPPQVYSMSVTPPVSIQVAPATTESGTLEMLAVTSGPTLDLASTATLLDIPDDFTWGIKWGALADMLNQDAQAKDVDRAQYCEKRYQEAVQLARAFPSVLQARVNGVPVYISSIFDMDSFSTGWENSANSTPASVGLEGRNFLALSPPPIGGTTVAVDVAANMAIPASDSDFIQVPPDVLDVIIDYAQHIASWKMGGKEFMETIGLYQNFLIEAANYNERLRQLDFFEIAMRQPAQRDKEQVPRVGEPAATGG